MAAVECKTKNENLEMAFIPVTRSIQIVFGSQNLVHEVLKFTLRSGDVFAVDIAGAQWLSHLGVNTSAIESSESQTLVRLRKPTLSRNARLQLAENDVLRPADGPTTEPQPAGLWRYPTSHERLNVGVAT